VLQDLLREVLEDEGYNVVAADSLPELLKRAPRHSQLLITDLLVDHELVGLLAIKLVRQTIHAQIPALICSAAQKQFEQFAAEIEQLRARVLEKPFTIDELIATVSQALKPADPEPSVGIPMMPAFV
jgi:CheY-like chemotaxis protein